MAASVKSCDWIIATVEIHSSGAGEIRADWMRANMSVSPLISKQAKKKTSCSFR